jgi:ferredoxin-NADP reductase
MQVFFEKREELVPGVWQYFFRPERPLDFVPGQYISLSLPEVVDDPRGGSRVFTLTSLPADAAYNISFVLKYGSPISHYKQRLQALEPGDQAMIGDAMGDLVLPKNTDIPLVFIAGGIGIASYISMLSSLIEQREQRSIFLFYSLKSGREQIFRDVTNAYPLALKTIAIAPNRLTAAQIKNTTPPNAQIYVSGSESFVDSLCKGLVSLGIHRDQLVFDFFDGYTEL